MTAFHYVCSECQSTFPPDGIRYLCPHCSRNAQGAVPLRGVLEVQYDLSPLPAGPLHKGDNKRPSYEHLCPLDSIYFPPIPVGNTPLFRAPSLEKLLGLSNVFLKNEGQNPSGSLKDRASFLVVAHAIFLDEEEIVTASTGNAASALAAICAAASKKAVIYVPQSAPRGKLVQSLLYGADVRLVDGNYDDAFTLSLEHTRKLGGLNRNTAYHPFTIEGKKTVSFEIFSQLGSVPDYIFVPMGDGVIISAVYKGFSDLRQLKVTDKMPRLVGVQGGKSRAIYDFVDTGVYNHADDPRTIADSICVSRPSNALLAKKVIEESNGFSLVVTDQEILDNQKTLARTTGIFAEPAAAATIAGLAQSASNIEPDSVCVALITGHGLKDIDAAMVDLEFPQKLWSTS